MEFGNAGGGFPCVEPEMDGKASMEDLDPYSIVVVCNCG